MSSANRKISNINSGRALVEFLHRYRIGTTAAFAAGPLRDLSEKAAERAISRAIAAGLIESHSLRGSVRYYTLTAKTAAGLEGEEAKPSMVLAFQARCQNYAMMSACVFGEQKRSRLTRDEFAAQLPMLTHPRKIKHFRTRYFLDLLERGAGIVRVGLFVPDLGQKIAQCVRKVRREMERRRVSALAPLVAEGLLVPYVLTINEKKAEQIRDGLSRDPFMSRVEVVPGYAEILGGRYDSKRH